MKTIAIALIFTLIAVIIQIGVNIIHTSQIARLQKEVICLRQDKVYVGALWCGNKIK